MIRKRQTGLTAEGVAKATAATLLVFFTFFLQGCSPFPEHEVKEAKRAAHLAFKARAPLYAPQSWTSVKTAESELDDEIWKQTGKLIPKNERIKSLAAQLLLVSNRALKVAERHESVARDRAEASIAKADALLWSSSLLKKEPGTGRRKELALLLDQARSDMNRKDYIEAENTALKVISIIRQRSTKHAQPLHKFNKMRSRNLPGS